MNTSLATVAAGPMIASPARTAVQHHRFDVESCSWKPRAVVAEDDKECCLGIAIMLRGMGYDVWTAANGFDAMSTLRRVGPIDLLVTDLVMPYMDGLDLILSVRLQSRLLPIVAATGASRPADRLHSAQCRGAASLLTKPFDRKEFMAAVDCALHDRP